MLSGRSRTTAGGRGVRPSSKRERRRPVSYYPSCLIGGVPDTRRHQRRSNSHVLVVRIVQHIADEQDDGLVAEIFPPMRGRIGLGPNVASLVHDRSQTVARVFHNLAFRAVDDRRTVAMAVPWHDATRLDHEAAEAQLAVLDIRRLLGEVDGAEHRVGDAFGLEGDWLAGVWLHLIGGGGAGPGRDLGSGQKAPTRG